MKGFQNNHLSMEDVVHKNSSDRKDKADEDQHYTEQRMGSLLN